MYGCQRFLIFLCSTFASTLIFEPSQYALHLSEQPIHYHTFSTLSSRLFHIINVWHIVMAAINFIQQVSKARNGLGTFVLPCKKILITYCNFGGSSVGMRDFLRSRLKGFASQYPEIEFQVLEKPGFHPVIKGFYTNEKSKQICCRKWNADVIENKLKLLINSTGSKLKKPKQNVISLNSSVRGIWSPFHVDPSQRYKI